MPAQLAFTMQSQQQTNWCWAAVATSIADYFSTSGPSGGPWQQCELVNAELGQTTCCQDGSTGNCNCDWYLDRALTRVGHLAGPVITGAESFTYVEGEINGLRPVGVRIQWNGDGGHFVVLAGYDDSNGNQFVDVEDPWYGQSTYDYNAFATGYQSGAGSWSHTYPVA
jgi:hypothetical protein